MTPETTNTVLESLLYPERINKDTDRMLPGFPKIHKELAQKELVVKRNRQKLTQQELADMTGILPSNLARFEKGTRIPTLILLEKYAAALGRHIELRISVDTED